MRRIIGKFYIAVMLVGHIYGFSQFQYGMNQVVDGLGLCQAEAYLTDHRSYQIEKDKWANSVKSIALNMSKALHLTVDHVQTLRANIKDILSRIRTELPELVKERIPKEHHYCSEEPTEVEEKKCWIPYQGCLKQDPELFFNLQRCKTTSFLSDLKKVTDSDNVTIVTHLPQYQGTEDGVTFDRAGYFLPSDLSKDFLIDNDLEKLCLGALMEPTLKRLFSPDLPFAWSYYGDVTGIFHTYPTYTVQPDYDPRARKWYQGAAHPPHDVVVVFDHTAGMGPYTGFDEQLAEPFTRVKTSIRALLDSLTILDSVSLVAYTNETKVPMCDSLMPADNATLHQMSGWLDELEVDPDTSNLSAGDTEAALRKAYWLIADWRRRQKQAGNPVACAAAILLVTSQGRLPGSIASTRHSVEEEVGENVDDVHLMTYSLGALAGDTDLRALACDNHGVWTNFEEGRSFHEIALYRHFMQYPAGGEESITLSEPYWDAGGLGMTITASAPVYVDGSFTGVTATDIPSSYFASSIRLDDLMGSRGDRRPFLADRTGLMLIESSDEQFNATLLWHELIMPESGRTFLKVLQNMTACLPGRARVRLRTPLFTRPKGSASEGPSGWFVILWHPVSTGGAHTKEYGGNLGDLHGFCPYNFGVVLTEQEEQGSYQANCATVPQNNDNFFHRLDLYDCGIAAAAGAPCSPLHPNTLTYEHSTFRLPKEAYVVSPPPVLDESFVARLHNAANRGDHTGMLKQHVQCDIRSTRFIESHWKTQNNLPLGAITGLNLFMLDSGVLRSLPGQTGMPGYDPYIQPWVRHALDNPDELTFFARRETRYNGQEHKIIRISKPNWDACNSNQLCHYPFARFTECHEPNAVLTLEVTMPQLDNLIGVCQARSCVLVSTKDMTVVYGHEAIFTQPLPTVGGRLVRSLVANGLAQPIEHVSRAKAQVCESLTITAPPDVQYQWNFKDCRNDNVELGVKFMRMQSTSVALFELDTSEPAAYNCDPLPAPMTHCAPTRNLSICDNRVVNRVLKRCAATTIDDNVLESLRSDLFRYSIRSFSCYYSRQEVSVIVVLGAVVPLIAFIFWYLMDHGLIHLDAAVVFSSQELTKFAWKAPRKLGRARLQRIQWRQTCASLFPRNAAVPTEHEFRVAASYVRQILNNYPVIEWHTVYEGQAVEFYRSVYLNGLMMAVSVLLLVITAIETFHPPFCIDTRKAALWVEGACLIAFMVKPAVLFWLKGLKGFFRDSAWTVVGFALLCFIVIDYTFACFSIFRDLEFPTRLAQTPRGVLLICQSRRLQSEIEKFFLAFPRIAPVTALLVFVNMIYSIIATQVFSDYYPDKHGFAYDANFETMGSSMLTMYVAGTGSNYPKVMQYAYPKSAFWALLFLSYFLISAIMITSYTVAVIWDSYVEEQQRLMINRRRQERKDLVRVFNVLDVKNTGELTFETWATFMKVMQPQSTPNLLKAMFQHIDTDCSGCIDIAEFFRLIDLVSLQELINPYLVADLPMVRWVNAKLRMPALVRVRDSVIFRISVNYVITLNVVDLAMLQIAGLSQESYAALTIAEKMFVVFFACEMLLKIGAVGPIRFWTDSLWNRMEAFIVFSSGMGMLILLISPAQWGPVLVILRALPVARVLLVVKKWRDFVEVLFQTAPAVAIVFLEIVILMYCYACLGMALFQKLYLEREDDNSLVLSNFRSLVYTMYTLAQIVMQADWEQPMYDAMRFKNNFYIWLYFGCFHYLVSVIALNIVIAVFLQYFASLDASSGNSIFEVEQRKIVSRLCLLNSQIKSKHVHHREAANSDGFEKQCEDEAEHLRMEVEAQQETEVILLRIGAKWMLERMAEAMATGELEMSASKAEEELKFWETYRRYLMHFHWMITRGEPPPPSQTKVGRIVYSYMDGSASGLVMSSEGEASGVGDGGGGAHGHSHGAHGHSHGSPKPASTEGKPKTPEAHHDLHSSGDTFDHEASHGRDCKRPMKRGSLLKKDQGHEEAEAVMAVDTHDEDVGFDQLPPELQKELQELKRPALEVAPLQQQQYQHHQQVLRDRMAAEEIHCDDDDDDDDFFDAIEDDDDKIEALDDLDEEGRPKQDEVMLVNWDKLSQPLRPTTPVLSDGSQMASPASVSPRRYVPPAPPSFRARAALGLSAAAEFSPPTPRPELAATRQQEDADVETRVVAMEELELDDPVIGHCFDRALC